MAKYFVYIYICVITEVSNVTLNKKRCIKTNNLYANLKNYIMFYNVFHMCMAGFVVL